MIDQQQPKSIQHQQAGVITRLKIKEDHLPDILRKGASAFRTEEEKHLYLFLTVAAASSLLTNVTGEYRDKIERPNLFCAGIARPASGKGLITYVQAQFEKIHQHFLHLSEQRKVQYSIAKSEYNKQKKDNPDIPTPKRPPFNVVFIPANVTSAKLIQHLNDNQSEKVPQILIDAEIDSLVGSVEAEIATISSILRKAFHGETISMSRKTDNEYIEIRECQLALSLTGTMNQIVKLVNNRSDGFISRLLLYVVDAPPQVSGIIRCSTCVKPKKVFEDLSDDYFTFWQFVQEEAFEVQLDDNHLEILQEYLEEKLQEAITSYDDEASQIVLRHGLMVLKISMVLTAMRKFEYAESSKAISCSDEDFETALAIIDRSLDNALQLYSMLPSLNYNRKSGHKDIFLSNLPKEFSRKEAVEKGKLAKVSEASIDRWLSGFLKVSKIVQVGSGLYQKA